MKIEKCKFCDNTTSFKIKKLDGGVVNKFSHVWCGSCGAYGPQGNGKKEAIDRWNNGRVFEDD